MQTLNEFIRIIRVYLRVSSQRQKNEETIKTQREAIIRFVLEKFGAECKIEYYYEDDGYSGEYLERPGLDKLRADLRDNSWNTLITYSPDRLSREFSDGNMLVDEILESGKDIFYVDGPSPSKETKLVTRIMSAISADDKEKILKKLYNGKLTRANNGVINHSTAPYGYNLIPKVGSKSSPNFIQTHLEINEEEAKVVHMIFKWIADERCSMRQVVKKLYELNIKPRKSKRGVWNTSTLNTLVKNETYIGKARFGSSYAVEPTRRIKKEKYIKVKKSSRRIRPKSDWIYIDVPPILKGQEGTDLFNRTQQQVKQNRCEATGNKNPNAYLLSGRIRCVCDYTRNGSGSKRAKNIYYQCSARKSCYPDSPCSSGGINADVADSYVWNKIAKILTDPRELSKSIENYYEEKASNDTNSTPMELEILHAQIKKLHDIRERTEAAYNAGAYDVHEFKDKLLPIKNSINTCTRKISEIESSLQEESVHKLDKDLLNKIMIYAPEALKKLDFEGKRKIILNTVTKIVAVPGNIKVEGIINIYKGTPLLSNQNLLLKGNKANISPLYIYVDFKTISRNRRIA